MQIGIGLPATIPDTPAQTVLEWARKADQGPFSSLGIIDRVAYPNYEPMVTLAAAAAVTRRIRLMTSVALGPLRYTGVLAKEAATVDVLSGGRLTLGLGIGGREDDYTAAGAPWEARGKRLEEQVQTMRAIWSGQTLPGVGRPVGPAPVQQGGPEVLIGGYVPPALQRAARLGDGFISGGAPPQAAGQMYQVVEETWRNLGRSGKPRFVAGTYVVAGAENKERGGGYIKDYYSFLGGMADTMAQGLPASPDELRGWIAQYEQAGVDELLLWPTVADLDQVDRLAEFASR